jgi:hypothetical protein
MCIKKMYMALHFAIRDHSPSRNLDFPAILSSDLRLYRFMLPQGDPYHKTDKVSKQVRKSSTNPEKRLMV